MAEILQGGKKETMRSDSAGAITTFALTNLTPNFTADLNAATAQTAADVVGTLVRELIRRGLIDGTVATH